MQIEHVRGSVGTLLGSQVERHLGAADPAAEEREHAAYVPSVKDRERVRVRSGRDQQLPSAKQRRGKIP